MSLRRRLLLTITLIILAGFLAIGKWIQGELRDSHSQVVEESLVDLSQLLATEVESFGFGPETFEKLEKIWTSYKARDFKAQVFNFKKDRTSLEIYVTDKKGIVVYSSQKNLIGQDFSNWNDVYLTLRGEYGVRATRVDPNDPTTAVYYVAAPIKFSEETAGVLTVFRTERSVLAFLNRALGKMFWGALFAVLIVALFASLIMLWITQPIQRLKDYALAVSEGQKMRPPETNILEIQKLTEAFETMRSSLEGQKKIEKFTQALTHELKSPLTAIRGAAELCLETMDAETRTKFLNNILGESNRTQDILEQLLKIAALESRRDLENAKSFELVPLLEEVLVSLQSLIQIRKVNILQKSQGGRILGDSFLIFQALRNVLQNAIEFSDLGGDINIEIKKEEKLLRVTIEDHGQGIPGYAQNRIFEKFYSLERPMTGKKGTGLGLSFVKEVIDLHHGEIFFQSPLEKSPGTKVTMILPLQ